MAVGNPYTEVSIANYNVSPPSDDGAQTAGNTVEWAKHKDKLADPIKTLAETTQTNITNAFDKRVMNGISTRTGNYTVLETDRGKVLNFTGGSTSTFTLLAAATAKTGFELIVTHTGTAVLTIDGATTETIDGSETIDLYPNQKAWLVCDGSNWSITVKNLVPGVFQKTNADSPYTVLTDDDGRFLDADASGGAITVNLPAAATAKNGFYITIKKTDSSANGVTIDGDGSETIDGDTTKVLTNQYQVITVVSDGSEWFAAESQAVLDLKAEQSVSGTSVDFTGITAAAKRITIMTEGVSTNGTSELIIQLGDSGGFETTGYNGATTSLSSSAATVSHSNGFRLTNTVAASSVLHGSAILILMDPTNNVWVCQGNTANATSVSYNIAGYKSLSNTLTQVRLTTGGGVNTFDAGDFNILVEQ